MKLISFIFTSVVVISITNYIDAQDKDCKVLKQEISEKYEGKCKNGLAHGKGTASGLDWYEGKFKKGLPDGFGTYIWSAGEKYAGYFKEGKMHGKGTYSFRFQGRDSTYIGLWKADSLTKVIIPPKYKVDKNINVTRYSVQKMGKENRVLFVFLQNGVQNRTITNFHLIASNGTQTSFSGKQGFENIKFPVVCKVTYVTSSPTGSSTLRVEFELTINEPGDWLVTLHN